MNRIVVVFQSRYGAARRYAEWIAQELSCDLFERKAIGIDDLKPYDTIIYGGGLYAGGVSGIDLLTKNFRKLSDKNLIVFTCGLADPKDDVNAERIKQSLYKVLPADMRDKIKLFHLRGAMDYSRLSLPHKAMMALVYKMTAKKDRGTLTDEEKEMLATYGKTVDFTDRAAILPIIGFVKNNGAGNAAIGKKGRGENGIL